MAQSDPEISFHRYFSTLPPYQQKRYSGRLEMAGFGVPELAEAFEAIRNEINARWQAYANRIQAPDGAVNLYLDYIDSTEVNAITFGHEEAYFVGITNKMLIHFSTTSEALWRLNPLRELLEIDLTVEVRNFLFRATLMIQLQFISSHELGHLFHGHIERTSLQEEFDEEESPAPAASSHNKMTDQAHEVEADGYAVHMLLDNLITTDSGDQIYRRLGSALVKEDCTLTLLLLSVGALFFFLRPRDFDPAKVRTLDHPFALARMNVVLNDFKGWCALNRPGLEEWATVEKFQRVMACVGQAANKAEQLSAWTRQGEFLKSPDGERYMSDLYLEQDKLRQNMSSRSWKLIPLPEAH